MITLLLLHPVKSIPAQVWSFKDKSVIRIGRSTDNHVILYSAVVSRHHVELRQVGSNWEIVNLGTNGTYVDGKRITQVPVTDGAIIRLARSGPNIKIRLGADALDSLPSAMTSDRPQAQRTDVAQPPTEVTVKGQGSEADIGSVVAPDAAPDADQDRGSALRAGFNATGVEPEASPQPMPGIIPVPSHLQLTSESSAGAAAFAPTAPSAPAIAVDNKPISSAFGASAAASGCNHAAGGELFCVDCGQPLQVLQTVGNYQLLQVLGRGEMGITYRAWRAGEHVVLKMLNASWAESPEARDALECEAETLRQLNHPQIPQIIDFFLIKQQPHLVMQWMEGLSLAQHIAATGAVPLARAIAWMLQICKVLDYLHSFTPPVLHRGIRPTALLFQPNSDTGDTVALVDFGAIKSVALGQSIPPGSTGYAAPEQMELYATAAADLYALAPILAFLLTGQNPVSFYAGHGNSYRFCSQSVPGIPTALAEVMQTLTHRRPADRYQSAQSVATALQAVRLPA